MHHDIKIEHVYFEALLAGDKMFEIRLNDRGYQKGDTITLKELRSDTAAKSLSGREYHGIITYVTPFQQQDGWVVFGHKPTHESKHESEGV